MANADAAPTPAVLDGGEMNAMAEKQPSYATIMTGIRIKSLSPKAERSTSERFEVLLSFAGASHAQIRCLRRNS